MATEQQMAFIERLAQPIKSYAPSYNILVVSPIIAQAILESGWGQSSLAAKYNNYFGMKCGTLWTGKSVNLTTQEEYQPGTLTTITDNFRAYDSLDEGVRGYFEFIQLSRYSNLKGVTDPYIYTRLLKEDGWATSSSYTDQLNQLIQQFNLTSYDQGGMPVPSKKEYMIQRMRYWCDQADLGYDQSNRWDIRPGGECDCSSLVYWVLWEAGYLTKPSGNLYAHTLYTGTLQRDLLAAGFKKLPNNGNPQPGYVLLNDTNHVAICTASGTLSQASIDENGRATGGASGDQSDHETNTSPYYNYPWNNYYAPPDGAYTGGSSGSGTSGLSLDQVAQQVVQGMWGNGDDRVQRLRAAGYDPDAVQRRVNELIGGTSAPTPSKSLDNIAQEVINGNWGNGDSRRNALTAAGYNPDEVQARVNTLMAGQTPTVNRKSDSEIAQEVINGNWGNGDDRRSKLSAAGYNPDTIQQLVNQMLTKGLDNIAQEVINGNWGNGDDRVQRLRAAGYDPDAVQRRVNELIG